MVSKGQLALADCINNQGISQKTFDALTSHGHNVGNPYMRKPGRCPDQSGGSCRGLQLADVVREFSLS